MYLLQHIPVRPEDHHLQVIAIGGRYFQEKTLTFGCSSSPSLYDAPAEVVLALACISSRTPRHYCLRQLDDAMIIADLPRSRPGTGHTRMSVPTSRSDWPGWRTQPRPAPLHHVVSY